MVPQPHIKPHSTHSSDEADSLFGMTLGITRHASPNPT